MPPFVRAVMNGTIILDNVDKSIFTSLKELGLAPSRAWFGRRCELTAERREDVARIFSQLRDLGFAFSAGKEWSPEEIFGYYRDELGLIAGPFDCVFWRGPNDIWIEQR